MANVETENKLSRLSRRVCCINTRVTELENEEPVSIDEYPTEDSSNAVSSGGVFSKFTTVDLQLADKADLVSGKVPLSQLPDDIQDLTGVGYTGTAINFADLPEPTLHGGEFYYVINSQGIPYTPDWFGGAYYKRGTYYSNGTAWVTDVNPFQAQQADVNAGIITDQFVSPYTLANASSVVHTTGTETITGAKTFNNSVTIAQKMISTEISSATIPGMILEVGNGSWANQQAAFSFRKNGSQIFGIDGLGQLILSGSMTMSNTTPESGTAFIGHGMRRVSTTAGFNFAWGESIASTTEPGLDLFPISGTHITNGILLRLSKDSGKTDVALQVNGNGNVGIGTSTDAGFRLDVNGTARVSSSLVVGSIAPPLATTAYIREVGSSTGTWRGRIIASGDTRAFLMGEYNSQAWLGAHVAALNGWSDFYVNPDGSAVLYLGDNNAIGLSTVVPIITISNATGQTTISQNTAQTTGTTAAQGLVISPTINNTGTYSGIYRGLYYNPTLTSLTGTTHRAIETVSGDVIFGSTSGNVGIGTTSPTYKLDVHGDGEFGTNNWLKIIDTASGNGRLVATNIMSVDFGGSFLFRNNAGTTEYARIFSTGNVGIGTSTDAGFKLDVNGTMRANSLTGPTGTIMQIRSASGQVLQLGNMDAIYLSIGSSSMTMGAKLSMITPTDGVLTLMNNGWTSFGRLQLGGTTSAFPAIKRNAADINFRLADDSGDAGITARTMTASSDVEITDSTKGVIMKSPDGTRYRMTVANGGTPVFTAI